MTIPGYSETLDDEDSYRFERITLSAADATRILLSYLWQKLWEQARNVLPLVIYLVLFLTLVLRESVEESVRISVGVVLVIFGLAFFMEGVRLGLIPFAERIGAGLPSRATLPVVLGFSFVLGAGATLSEPAVGVIKAAGKFVSPERAPVIYYILREHTILLVLAIAIGVGLASLFGILRVVRNWSMTPVLLPLVITILVLTAVAASNKYTLPVVGLAWDTGGVIVGPVTLPLVLAVAVGLAAVAGRADVGKAGFGVAGLAALFPVLTILILGLVIYYGGFAGGMTLENLAAAGSAQPEQPSTYLSSLLGAWLAALQALPLIVFLYIVLVYFVRASLYNRSEVLTGLTFSIVGVFLLNAGIMLGLNALGGQAGEVIPKTFSPAGDALFHSGIGKSVTIAFGFFLGYVATICEPAFNTLAIQVEEVTVGAIKKKLLIHTVALGVAVGVAVGVAKLLFDVPLSLFAVPLYLLAIFLSLAAGDEFTSIAWDAGASTTGTITVPLILALGLGLGSFLNVTEGFGIVAMGTVFPIVAVLSLGLVVRMLRKPTQMEALDEEG